MTIACLATALYCCTFCMSQLVCQCIYMREPVRCVELSYCCILLHNGQYVWRPIYCNIITVMLKMCPQYCIIAHIHTERPFSIELQFHFVSVVYYIRSLSLCKCKLVCSPLTRAILSLHPPCTCTLPFLAICNCITICSY